MRPHSRTRLTVVPPLLLLPLLLLVALLPFVAQHAAAPAAGSAKDIGEEGKRGSQYYKWQRDKQDVAVKAAQAKERQLAREAEAGGGRRKVELSAEEKQLQGLRRAITRKEQYKREAIEAENFEEAARLRDEISAATEELEQLQAEAKASAEQCEEEQEGAGETGEEEAMARDEAAEEAEQEAEEEEEEEEDLVVVGADGIEITAASEEEDDEDEDYTSRCPEGYFDHDKDHRSPCEPINDPDIAKLETMVVHLDDIAYEFRYLTSSVAPIVSRIKALKDSLLDSGFIVAQRGHNIKQARGALGGKKKSRATEEGDAAAGAAAEDEAADEDDVAKAQEDVELMAGRELIEAINSTALLRPNASETPARESQLAQAKVEVQGGLGQLVNSWAKDHVTSGALLPPFKAPLMSKEQLAEAQKKGSKLKAKTAVQLYGWVCPGCPDSRGEENSRGRFVLALPRDVTQRLGTLFISRRQRVTIDGHGHSWAQQELIMSQNNERRFQILSDGRLKLLRLTVRDAALSTVGHGGAILVSEGGMLEVDRCEFRTNIARSQGGAIAVEGSALLVDSSFIANYAFGSGGAVHVGFNAPGRPPSPPTLTIKNCDFLDNVGKNGGGHAVHYGKSSARQGQQYDNQLQLSSAG